MNSEIIGGRLAYDLRIIVLIVLLAAELIIGRIVLDAGFSRADEIKIASIISARR